MNFILKLFFALKNLVKLIISYISWKLRRENGNQIYNVILKLIKSSSTSIKDKQLKNLNLLPKSLLFQWRSILRNSDVEYKVISNPEKIVFVPFNGFGEADLAVSSIFGKYFQMNGHDVSIMYCGSALPCCGWNEYGNGKLEDIFFPKRFEFNKLDRCKSCYSEIHQLYPELKIKLNSLNEFILDDDLSFSTEYADKFIDMKNFKKEIYFEGLRVSEHAYSSTLRKLLRGDLLQDKETFSMYRRFLISSILYVKLLQRFFDKVKPSKIICNHGIYLEHGTLVDFCKLKKINCIVYGFPYRKNTLMSAHNDTYHRDYLSEPNSRWENLQLDGNQVKILDEYMNSKVSGGRDNVNYHPNPIIDKKKLFEKIGIKINEQYDCILTNTLWDAQIFYSSNIFTSMLDWLYQSIEFYKLNPDKNLVIRIHPAESKAGFSTNQPVYNEIISKFPELPQNVFIVKAESDISTYTLIENANLTIIYGTNAGLEAAYRGKPLIVAGESNSRGKGFGLDVNSKEEYFKTLKSGKIDNYEKNIAQQRAIKYCYHLFFRRWYETSELFEYELMQLRQINIKFKSLKDLQENKFLKQYLDCLINNKPFEFEC